MKKCPKCAEQIEDGAKKCKHCGSDLRIWPRRHPIATLVLVLFGLPILFAVIATGGGSKPTPAPAPVVDTRTPEEVTRDQAALAKLTRTYDDIDRVADYVDPSSPSSDRSNNLHLYIRKFDGGDTVLRLRASYTGDDWLFVQKYSFNVDGRSYEITPSEVKRDNSSDVWEWSDELIAPTSNPLVDGSILDVVKAIAASKEAKLRYEGRQYQKDRTITAAEKAALNNVLMGYAALTGAPAR